MNIRWMIALYKSFCLLSEYLPKVEGIKHEITVSRPEAGLGVARVLRVLFSTVLVKFMLDQVGLVKPWMAFCC